MYNAQEIAIRIENLSYGRGNTVKKTMMESGVGKGVVDYLKRGSMPSADKIAAIADYLDVSTDYLLGRTDNPTPIGKSSDENLVVLLNPREKSVIMGYRSNPDMQRSVEKLLGIDSNKLIRDGLVKSTIGRERDKLIAGSLDEQKERPNTLLKEAD